MLWSKDYIFVRHTVAVNASWKSKFFLPFPRVQDLFLILYGRACSTIQRRGLSGWHHFVLSWLKHFNSFKSLITYHFLFFFCLTFKICLPFLLYFSFFTRILVFHSIVNFLKNFVYLFSFCSKLKKPERKILDHATFRSWSIILTLTLLLLGSMNKNYTELE